MNEPAQTAGLPEPRADRDLHSHMMVVATRAAEGKASKETLRAVCRALVADKNLTRKLSEAAPAATPPNDAAPQPDAVHRALDTLATALRMQRANTGTTDEEDQMFHAALETVRGASGASPSAPQGNAGEKAEIPTPEMIASALKDADKTNYYATRGYVDEDIYRDAYRAMLAASPTPPSAGNVEGKSHD